MNRKIMKMTKNKTLRFLRRGGAALAFALCAGAVRAAVPFTAGDYYVLDLTDGALRQATNVTDPARFSADEYKTKKIVFRKIPAGSFTMQPNSGHPASVGIGEYAIAIYPLTQGQYAQIHTWISAVPVLPGQGFGVGDFTPAHMISQISFANLASQISGHLSTAGVSVSLPNEAQWEKAARAGSSSTWFFGTSAAELGDYAWTSANSGGGAQDVGKKLPNPWGLYDVYGNVKEWCLDRFEDWYRWGEEKQACDHQPGGYPKSDSAYWVHRGGSSAEDASSCSSDYRGHEYPNTAWNYGARLVLNPSANAMLPTDLPEENFEDPWDDTTVYPADEPAAAACTPTFTIDRVQQHYPWDGKIDIHYTLSGVDESRFHALYFTATGGGKSMTIFVKDRGGPSDPTGKKDEVLARNGSHCYIWDLLEVSTNSTQCADDAAVTTLTNVFARGTAKVTGRIVDTGAPVRVLNGDYKVLDIASGAVTSLTNADPLQFNTLEYKTEKIAFRKVKARPSMRVDEDFYIAVFPLTMAQTRALNDGTMPETYQWGWIYNTEEKEVSRPDGTRVLVKHERKEGVKIPADPYKGDYWWQYQKGELFPMNRISYNDVRGVLDNDLSQSTKGNIGTNEQGTASLFLKYKNAKVVVLDLPDGFEWELAARGNTTYERWFFGDDDVNMGYYAWYWDNSLPYTRVKCLNEVGLRYPNQFGLWDVYGNVWETCRNYRSNTRDPEWVAQYPSTRELRGGASYFRSRSASHYRPFPLTKEDEEQMTAQGESFGGSYNWEGYAFYGYRPILVSHR